MTVEGNYRQKYLEMLSKGLENTWLKQRHTDVTVRVAGKAYGCHKLLLGAISDFFGNIVISCGDTVDIGGMESAVFEQLLEYMYTGKHDSVLNNPANVLRAAVKVQLKGLQEICEDVLKSRLTTENCIGFLTLARELGCTSLEKHSWTFLLEFFPDVIKGQEFKNVSFEDLLAIIDDDNLNTSSEETVCDAVLYWISIDQGSRSSFLGQIYDYLRFPLMKKSYIQSLSENTTIKNSKHGDKYLNLCSTVLSGGDILGTVSPRQCNNRTAEMLCTIGLRSRQPNPETTDMKCYSFIKDLSYTMSKLPIDTGASFAVCSSDNDVFVSGGYMGLMKILRFRTTENRWQNCGSLTEGRWGHGMASHDGDIYMFGGSKKIPETLSSIEMYSTETDKCTVIGNLSVPVSFMSSAVIGDQIYVFGGKMADRQISNHIQRFDTKTKACTIVAELPVVESTISRCAVIEKVAYIFFSSGEVVKFLEGETPTISARIPRFDHFGVVSYNDQILVDGSFGNQSSTVVFDPTTAVVSSFTRTIKVNMCNFHCMKLVVSKNVLESGN